MLNIFVTVSARFAQSSKRIMQRQPNAYSSDRLVHPQSSSNATIADILESGHPIRQTSAKKKPKSLCVPRLSEEKIGASQYEDKSDSVSDSGN